MTEIKLTGREIGVPGDTNHAAQCIVDGQPVTVAIANVDARRKQDIARALGVELTSHRSGIGRAIREALRTALQTNGEPTGKVKSDSATLEP
ncbi:MAG: hypothetical protein Q7S29_02915 [Candidatus Peribacter sp.]|nr:hypothetical protein [Candidatus Peribacter sp.]